MTPIKLNEDDEIFKELMSAICLYGPPPDFPADSFENGTESENHTESQNNNSNSETKSKFDGTKNG